jgi:hypothetical protein
MRSRFFHYIYIYIATTLKSVYTFDNKNIKKKNLHSQYRILQETRKEFVNCVTSKYSIQKFPFRNFLAVKQHFQDIQLCLCSQIYKVYEECVSIKSRNFPVLTLLSYSIPVRRMIFPIVCADDAKLRVFFIGHQWEKAVSNFSEK